MKKKISQIINKENSDNTKKKKKKERERERIRGNGTEGV